MNVLTRRILDDCKPSLGVTEPGAIALAVAAARERTRGAVTAEMTAIDSEIYIRADVKTEVDACSVTIRHTHTNIVSIVLNGEELLEKTNDTRKEGAAAPEIHGFSFAALVSYAKTVPIEELSFLREAFEMDLALLDAMLCALAFAFSRFGFGTLIGVFYPICGYLGIPFVAMLFFNWKRAKKKAKA